MPSRKRKTGKPAAIVLRWHRQVLRHEWRGKTHRTQIIAVAAVLIDHADPGGGEVWPSIDTIRSLAGVSRNTACTALAELQTAGMLTRHGKRHGTTNYRLRLVAVRDEILPNDAPSISNSISDSTPRDTQPPTSELNEEEEEKDPASGGVNAASAGIRIEGDEADRIVGTFVTAFDTKWADRPRGKTIAVTKLEPSRPQLREALITKTDAGWPIKHLVERAFDGMPTDERSIKHLTGLVADKIRRLPAEPDATARKAIEAGKVAAEATKKRETDKAAKKAKAEKERIASEKRRILDALDAEMLKLENAAHKLYGLQAGDEIIKTFYADIGITNLDADFEALDNRTLANYTSRCRTKAAELQASVKRAEQDALKALDEAEAYCRRTYLDRYRAWHEVETDIDTTLAEHGINRDTMRDHHNIATATRLYRELGDKMATLPKPTTEKKVEMW